MSYITKNIVKTLIIINNMKLSRLVIVLVSVLIGMNIAYPGLVEVILKTT